MHGALGTGTPQGLADPATHLQEQWQHEAGKSYSDEHPVERGLFRKGGGDGDLLWAPTSGEGRFS